MEFAHIPVSPRAILEIALSLASPNLAACTHPSQSATPD